MKATRIASLLQAELHQPKPSSCPSAWRADLVLLKIKAPRFCWLIRFFPLTLRHVRRFAGHLRLHHAVIKRERKRPNQTQNRKLVVFNGKASA